MNVGDIVKWIGFPDSILPPGRTGTNSLGMVIRTVTELNCERVDVMWGDGSRGNLLYAETLEVVCEMVNENFRIQKQH